MGINILLQANKVLHRNNYTIDELKHIYEYLINLDNKEIIEYNSKCSLLTYDSDLTLYIEILDILISIFESKEEYEKCELILRKKNESLKINNKKTN